MTTKTLTTTTTGATEFLTSSTTTPAPTSQAPTASSTAEPPPPVAEMVVVQGSMVLAGEEEPSAEMQAAVREAVSRSLGVQSEQVSISGLVRATGSGRRLLDAGGWRLAFEVALVSSSGTAGDGGGTLNDTNATSAELEAGASAEAVIAGLRSLSQNPAALVDTLEETMEELGVEPPPGGVEVVVAAPAATAQRLTAQRHAGPWGICLVRGSGAAPHGACVPGAAGQERRGVWCVDADNAARQLKEANCFILPALAGVRPCTQGCQATDNASFPDMLPSGIGSESELTGASAGSLAAAGVAMLCSMTPLCLALQWRKRRKRNGQDVCCLCCRRRHPNGQQVYWHGWQRSNECGINVMEIGGIIRI